VYHIFEGNVQKYHHFAIYDVIYIKMLTHNTFLPKEFYL